MTPWALAVRASPKYASAFSAVRRKPECSRYAEIMRPVRPLPALQWMATTLSLSLASQSSTLAQKSAIISSGHGLWSSKGNRWARPSNCEVVRGEMKPAEQGVVSKTKSARWVQQDAET